MLSNSLHLPKLVTLDDSEMADVQCGAFPYHCAWCRVTDQVQVKVSLLHSHKVLATAERACAASLHRPMLCPWQASRGITIQMLSKSMGPSWLWTLTPMEASGFLQMKRNICMSISLEPSFCGGGKGCFGTGTPRKLQHIALSNCSRSCGQSSHCKTFPAQI